MVQLLETLEPLASVRQTPRRQDIARQGENKDASRSRLWAFRATREIMSLEAFSVAPAVSYCSYLHAVGGTDKNHFGNVRSSVGPSSRGGAHSRAERRGNDTWNLPSFLTRLVRSRN